MRHFTTISLPTKTSNHHNSVLMTFGEGTFLWFMDDWTGYFQKVFLPKVKEQWWWHRHPSGTRPICLPKKRVTKSVHTNRNIFHKRENKKKSTRCVLFSTRKLNTFKKQKRVFRQKASLQMLFVIRNGYSYKKKKNDKLIRAVANTYESNHGDFKAFKDVDVNITSKRDAICVGSWSIRTLLGGLSESTFSRSARIEKLQTIAIYNGKNMTDFQTRRYWAENTKYENRRLRPCVSSVDTMA